MAGSSEHQWVKNIRKVCWFFLVLYFWSSIWSSLRRNIAGSFDHTGCAGAANRTLGLKRNTSAMDLTSPEANQRLASHAAPRNEGKYLNKNRPVPPQAGRARWRYRARVDAKRYALLLDCSDHTGQRHVDAIDNIIAAPRCGSKTKLGCFGTLGTRIVTVV